MAQDFETPYIDEELNEKPRRPVALIVAIIIILLICCCCAGMVSLYYGIEPVMDLMGIPIPW